MLIRATKIKKRQPNQIKKLYEENEENKNSYTPHPSKKEETEDYEITLDFLETKNKLKSQVRKNPTYLPINYLNRRPEIHFMKKQGIDYPHYGNVGQQIIFENIPNYSSKNNLR